MPVKTILVTIGLVLATLAALYLVRLLARIEMLLVISLFFAVVLTPLVDRVHARMRIKRGLAAGLVFVFVIAAVALMMFIIIKPLVTETRQFAENFPTYLSDAREGRGALGGLVKRYELDRRYEENKETIENAFRNAGSKAFSYVGRAFSGVLTLLTIMVLSFMMLLYGPQLTNSAMAAVPPDRRERVKAVAADASKAVTGYMSGNLLISVIAGHRHVHRADDPRRPLRRRCSACGSASPTSSRSSAPPSGRSPPIAVAFLHSCPPASPSSLFYIVYQQFENHVLQVTIMSKTVSSTRCSCSSPCSSAWSWPASSARSWPSPLAGVIQVVVRDLWDDRRGSSRTSPPSASTRSPVGGRDEEAAERRPVERHGGADPDSRPDADAEPDAPSAPPTDGVGGRRGRRPHHRLADPGQDPRRDHRGRGRLPDRSRWTIGRTSADPTRARIEVTAADDDALDRAARPPPAPRRQPGHPARRRRSWPPTIDGVLPAGLLLHHQPADRGAGRRRVARGREPGDGLRRSSSDRRTGAAHRPDAPRPDRRPRRGRQRRRAGPAPGAARAGAARSSSWPPRSRRRSPRRCSSPQVAERIRRAQAGGRQAAGRVRARP